MALRVDWRVFRQSVIVESNQSLGNVIALSFSYQTAYFGHSDDKWGAVHKAKCRKPCAVLRSVKFSSVKRVYAGGLNGVDRR